MNKPKIRFKGFQGEWKEVKLSSIAIFSKGQGYSKSDLRENGHPIILYGRMYTKYQFAINEVDTFSNLKGAYVLSEGNEIIMPASGETSEDIACASAVLAKGIILGGDLNIVRFDLKKYSTPFLALTITYSKTHYDLSKCAQGKSVVHLHNEAISKTAVFIPSLPEQRALASYFTSLDAQIAASTSRLSSIKQVKAASLLNMFPQKGETVPRVRFKGFEGEWKEKALGDVVDDFKYGINAAAVSYDGENKYLRITDIDEESRAFIKDELTSPDVDLSSRNEYIMQEGDIVIARTGASVGKSYIYHPIDGKVYFAGFLIRARVNKKVDREFVYLNTLTDGFKKYIRFVSQRSGQPGVNVEELKSYLMNLPASLPEQRAIASYFTALDAQITLHRERLEKLKQIKAACLEKMFA